MSLLPNRAGWLTRWATDAPVQAGIAGASWSISGTFARGLLPRDPMQQAIATGVVAATHYELTATAWRSGATMPYLAARRLRLIMLKATTAAPVATDGRRVVSSPGLSPS